MKVYDDGEISIETAGGVGSGVKGHVTNHPEVKSIFDEYDTPEKSKGNCHKAASKIADVLRKDNEPFEVHSFYTKGFGRHVMVKHKGEYLDPTGKQYGQPLSHFKESEIPKEYKFFGKLSPEQFNWKYKRK